MAGSIKQDWRFVSALYLDAIGARAAASMRCGRNIRALASNRSWCSGLIDFEERLGERRRLALPGGLFGWITLPADLAFVTALQLAADHGSGDAAQSKFEERARAQRGARSALVIPTAPMRSTSPHSDRAESGQPGRAQIVRQGRLRNLWPRGADHRRPARCLLEQPGYPARAGEAASRFYCGTIRQLPQRRPATQE